MKFSQACGSSVVPLLSRIVLAGAFVTAGYNKLMKDASFTEAQKDILVSYGVEVTDVASAAAPVMIVPAAYQATPEDDDAAAEAKTALEDQAEAVQDAAKKATEDVKAAGEALQEDVGEALEKTKEALSDDAQPVVPASEAGDAASPPPAPGAAVDPPYRAKSMHKITLLCHNAGWPAPQWLALLAAVTEFVGGAFLLLGFLSRIWGLGLAIAMGVAFYLVSMRFNAVHQTNPFTFAENIPAFNTLYSQLGLFVLAFGVFLTGPGPVSLDRLLFRRRSKPTIEYDEEIVDESPPSRVTIGSGRAI